MNPLFLTLAFLAVFGVVLLAWWISRPDELLEGDWQEDDPWDDGGGT